MPIADDDTTIQQVGPKLLQAACSLLPRVFERLAARDPGDPQDDSQASWAGSFDEDYASVDWSQPARAIHDQVRAWHLAFELSRVAGRSRSSTASA